MRQPPSARPLPGSAKIRLRDGSGQFAEDWAEVQYREPANCGHGDSICPECIGSWEWDWEIHLPCGCEADRVGAEGHDPVNHVS